MPAQKSPEKRYINDLRRFAFGQAQFLNFKGVLVPIGLAIIFLALVGLVTASSQAQFGEDWLLIVIAAVIGGYMALNIGANDVANNMGPAVGGKVITVFWAIVIAAICESAGISNVSGGYLYRAKASLIHGINASN